MLLTVLYVSHQAIYFILRQLSQNTKRYGPDGVKPQTKTGAEDRSRKAAESIYHLLVFLTAS